MELYGNYSEAGMKEDSIWYAIASDRLAPTPLFLSSFLAQLTLLSLGGQIIPIYLMHLRFVELFGGVLGF